MEGGREGGRERERLGSFSTLIGPATVLCKVLVVPLLGKFTTGVFIYIYIYIYISIYIDIYISFSHANRCKPYPSANSTRTVSSKNCLHCVPEIMLGTTLCRLCVLLANCINCLYVCMCVGVCAASEEGGLASSLRLEVSLRNGGIQYGGLPP